MGAVGRAPGVRQGISAPQLRLTVLQGVAAVHVAGLQEVPYPRQEILMLHTLIMPVMADCLVAVRPSCCCCWALGAYLFGQQAFHIAYATVY